MSQKGLKLSWGIGDGEVLEVLDLGWIRFHTFSGEDYNVEAYLRLPASALGTVEDDSIPDCCLHELYQVSVMLLRHSPIETYIIMDCDAARELVCHLLHVHLKDILQHHKTEWLAQEPVFSTMGIEGHKA